MWCFASECHTLSVLRLSKSPKVGLLVVLALFMWSNFSVGCVEGQLYGSVVASAGFNGVKSCAAGSALTFGRVFVGLVFFFE